MAIKKIVYYSLGKIIKLLLASIVFLWIGGYFDYTFFIKGDTPWSEIRKSVPLLFVFIFLNMFTVYGVLYLVESIKALSRYLGNHALAEIDDVRCVNETYGVLVKWEDIKSLRIAYSSMTKSEEIRIVLFEPHDNRIKLSLMLKMVINLFSRDNSVFLDNRFISKNELRAVYAFMINIAKEKGASVL
ncbi:hypothetical protein [Myroides marinus]|uniref:hypothetical protein n=1 Tax=Myroides marinus TaxID=703342 RepID=UPI00257520A6|nr:hypothetical protein [Myroides marinus]MDM1402627.1 hypothetical protein [Myroides marinus]MDM1531185.1 hypothetical protein [Myroides marinus]MDM1538107.1 hypothetical protein [Myroides marinus]